MQAVRSFGTTIVLIVLLGTSALGRPQAGPNRNPPSVSITNPTNGATVSGVITVSAEASGDFGIRFVGFSVDGEEIALDDSRAPYAVSWNTWEFSNGPHNLTAVARDSNGNQATSSPFVITVQNVPITNTYSVPDNGGQLFELASGPSLGSVTIRSVTIEPNQGVDAPAGVGLTTYRYEDDEGQALIAEAGFAASAPITSGRIYSRIEGPTTNATGVGFANPGTTTATITFYFTNSEGISSPPASFTLQAGRQFAAGLFQPPFNGLPMEGTFTFTSTVPVGAIGLHSLRNERGDYLFSPLPVVPISTASTTFGPTLLPLYTAGGGWTTEIILTNPADSPQSGTLDFLAPDGLPAPTIINGVRNTRFPFVVPARTAARFVATSDTPGIQTGSVRVTPTLSNVTPVATAIFYYQDRGTTVSYASVLATPPSAQYRVFAEKFGNLGAIGSIRSGVAIANMSEASVLVQLDLAHLDGQPAGSTNLTLASLGQTSKFVDELFPNLPTNFRGTMRLQAIAAQSTAPIVLTGIRGRYNERGEFLLSSTPPVDTNVPPSGSPILFPHVAYGAGYSTQLILFADSPGGTSGRMVHRSREGILLANSVIED